MAVFKCKMCGGNIEFEKGATVGVCDSCGTQQTLPRIDDDYKVNLYDRANHFRRNHEYDKAKIPLIQRHIGLYFFVDMVLIMLRILRRIKGYLR